MARPVVSQGSPEWCEFVVAYFKEMRAEINLRVTNHSSLVAAKVVTTGALIGFLVTQSPSEELGIKGVDVRVLGLLFVPLIAVLYDVMIAKNVKGIHTLGVYVRDRVETVYEGVFWESFAGQKQREGTRSCGREVLAVLGRAWRGASVGEKDPHQYVERNYGAIDIVVLMLFDLGAVGVGLWAAFASRIALGAVAALGYLVLLSLAFRIMCSYILFEVEPPQAGES